MIVRLFEGGCLAAFAFLVLFVVFNMSREFIENKNYTPMVVDDPGECEHDWQYDAVYKMEFRTCGLCGRHEVRHIEFDPVWRCDND